MTTVVRFPTIPATASSDLQFWANQYTLVLENLFSQLQQQAGSGWFVTAYTATRSYSNAAPSVTSIGNVLCTLIADLRAAQKLG